MDALAPTLARIAALFGVLPGRPWKVLDAHGGRCGAKGVPYGRTHPSTAKRKPPHLSDSTQKLPEPAAAMLRFSPAMQGAMPA